MMTTTEPSTTSTDRRAERIVVAGRVALAAGAAYALLLLVIHLARPDVSISWQTTSEYARGTGGWAMVVAFLLSAVGLAALAVSASAVVRSVPGKIGAIALLVAAIGTAVGGVFVTDPIETAQNAQTLSGTVHGLAAGLALMLTPIAALILNVGLARRADSKPTRMLLLALGVLPLVALVIFMVVQTLLLPADGTFGPDVPIGPVERVLVGAYALWQIGTARAVTRALA